MPTGWVAVPYGGLVNSINTTTKEEGEQYAEKIQTEEILLRGVFGGGDLSSIYQGKGDGEAVQDNIRNPEAAQLAAHRGAAAEIAAYQFHPVRSICHIDL